MICVSQLRGSETPNLFCSISLDTFRATRDSEQTSNLQNSRVRESMGKYEEFFGKLLLYRVFIKNCLLDHEKGISKD